MQEALTLEIDLLGWHTGIRVKRRLPIATLPAMVILGLLAPIPAPTDQARAQDELLIFAVVSEPPKDRSRIAVKASINDVPSDTKLLASDAILNNLIWKKLEICHALRVEGTKASDGYKVQTVRVIDAGMLPMTLQSFAGDCLIKKAIEIAPLVD